jgi:transcriptional regulator of acetoin/glycerol metabolism
VRELRHALERLVIMSEQGVPQVESLPLGAGIAAAATSAVGEPDTLNLEALEKQAIQRAIAQHHGNLSKAAQSLGLGRTTLYRKMTRHGIE